MCTVYTGVHVGPFGHGADLLACVLCVEPFSGHGGDLSNYYVYCVRSHLDMDVIF